MVGSRSSGASLHSHWTPESTSPTHFTTFPRFSFWQHLWTSSTTVQNTLSKSRLPHIHTHARTHTHFHLSVRSLPKMGWHQVLWCTMWRCRFPLQDDVARRPSCFRLHSCGEKNCCLVCCLVCCFVCFFTICPFNRSSMQRIR